MKNITFILIIFFFFTSCSFNKVTKKHGVRNLEKKQTKLFLNKTNINEIREILGPASTESKFDNKLLIYIERINSSENLIKLGKKKLIVNNVLVLEVNNRGILVGKEFYNIDKMNDLTFAENNTDNVFTKKSFVYDFLSSMRQKINDPLGKRKKP